MLGDRQPEEEPAALRDVGDPEPCPRARRGAREVDAVEDDPAGHRLDEARDRAQRRRLAGAVRAEQRDDLARADRQVDVADHRRPGRSRPSGPRAASTASAMARPRSDAPGCEPRRPRCRRGRPRSPAGSRRTASGAPRAITWPNSSTTTSSQIPSTRPMSWSTSSIAWPASTRLAQLRRRAPRSRACRARRPARRGRRAAASRRARGRRRRACAGPATARSGARRRPPRARAARAPRRSPRSRCDRRRDGLLERPPQRRAVRGDEQVLAHGEVVEELDRLPRARQAAPRAGVRRQAR